MRLYRIHLKDACLCEAALTNATITFKDCVGENKAEKSVAATRRGYYNHS